MKVSFRVRVIAVCNLGIRITRCDHIERMYQDTVQNAQLLSVRKIPYGCLVVAKTNTNTFIKDFVEQC